MRRRPTVGVGAAQKPNSSRAWSPLDSDNLRLLLTPASFAQGSAWLDQSGYDHHFEGLVGSVSELGSRSCVTFDGTSLLEGCILSDLMDSSGRWYAGIVAYANQDGTSPVGTGVLMVDADNTAAAAGIAYDRVDGQDKYVHLLHRASDGSQWNGISPLVNDTSPTAPDDADRTWVFLEVGADGTSIRARLTDVAGERSSSTRTQDGPPHRLTDTMVLAGGVENSTTQHWNGGLQLVFAFKGAPSAADMTGMRAWVASQFGFTAPASDLF